MPGHEQQGRYGVCALLVLLLLCSQQVLAQAISWFPEIKPFPHADEFSVSAPEPTDYLLGLGALQKIGGRWRHKHSEHIEGELARYTWQIREGYSALEGLQWLQDQLPENARPLYQCEGRSCGSSAQWANRVFHQRVLYGHDERQHYSVFQLEKGGETYTLVLYAVDRANRRHYLHLDVLRHTPAVGGDS